jgi:hypothetical protein
MIVPARDFRHTVIMLDKHSLERAHNATVGDDHAGELETKIPDIARQSISPDILARLAVAFTPPTIEEEPTSLFRRRLSGMIIRREDARSNRQLRSIWKKLFLDG